MQALMKKGMPRMLTVVGLFTILTGIYLLWELSGHFSGTFMGSGSGILLSTGALFGLIALLIGVHVSRPTVNKLGEIAAEGGRFRGASDPRRRGGDGALAGAPGNGGAPDGCRPGGDRGLHGARPAHLSCPATRFPRCRRLEALLLRPGERERVQHEHLLLGGVILGLPFGGARALRPGDVRQGELPGDHPA